MSDVTPFFLFLVAVHCLGSLQYGYHIGEMNTPQSVISCQVVKKGGHSASGEGSFVDCIEMSDVQYGTIVSLFTIGGLLGSIVAGRLADKFGRKPVSIANCFTFIAGPLAMSCANAMWSLGLGRILSGIGCGFAIVLIPIYLNEVSPIAIRGIVGAMTQLSCVTGILISQLAGVYLSTTNGWRIILGSGGMIGLVQFLLLWLTIESPKWLAAQPGKFAMAKSSLIMMRGRADVESEMRLWRIRDEDEAEVESRSLLISNERDSSEDDRNTKQIPNSIAAFLLDSKLRPATSAVFITQMAQQFTGTNAVVFYSTTILASLLPEFSAWISVGISLVNVLVTLIAANLVDRTGRKVLLLVSVAGMTISSVLLAVGINGNYKVLSAISATCIIGSFGFGLGPIPFLLISEYFEVETVGMAQSLGISVSWLSTFTVGVLFPVMRQSLGGSSFYVFAAFGVLFFLLFVKYVPESRGKTVQEVWHHS